MFTWRTCGTTSGGIRPYLKKLSAKETEATEKHVNANQKQGAVLSRLSNASGNGNPIFLIKGESLGKESGDEFIWFRMGGKVESKEIYSGECSTATTGGNQQKSANDINASTGNSIGGCG